MCGILGAIPAIESKKFEHSLNLITHRGPDSSGIWSDGQICMGHRRLSILDVSSNGDQPMHIGDRYHIIFNGEVYNFLELKNELIKKGYSFTNETDTEVILSCYVEWGDSCVKRFNGMWSIAIWDSSEQKLFLSRDRLGKKPLYYIYNGEQFIFGSEQKSLLPFLPSVAIRDNFKDLVENSYAYESTDQCLFKGITRFPAASNGIFYKGKLFLQ